MIIQIDLHNFCSVDIVEKLQVQLQVQVQMSLHNNESIQRFNQAFQLMFFI